MGDFFLGLGICLLILIVFVSIGALALLIARAIEDYLDRRYTPSPEEAAWEAHCATTPAVGEVGDCPIFDALCFEQWEAVLRARPVYDIEEWDG